jgi:hypothetical protein
VYEDNQPQTTSTEHRISFAKPDENSGLEASCTFQKVRKNSSSAASNHGNGDGVVRRPSNNNDNY